MQKDFEIDTYEPWVKRIIRALNGLEYGSVQITVHDSQITQIERIEKQRFPLESIQIKDKMNRKK